MKSIQNVLANGQSISGSAAVPLAEINGEVAVDVRYDVLVESVSGAPTTAKLECKIQRWMNIAAGEEYEYGGAWYDVLGPGHRYFFAAAPGGSDQSSNIRYLNSFTLADYAASATGVATVILRDGSSTGDVLDQINLPAGGHVQRNWTEPLHFPNGLYVHVTALGTGINVRGSAFGSYDNHAPSLLPGGAFPSVLATQALSTPRLISRRVMGGARTRLVLTPTFTGGTSPMFVVSATANVRV